MQMGTSAEFKYLETKILTASPEELTLIVFDVLIMSSSKALEKIQTTATDIQGIHDELRRAQRALALLMGSLSFEIGGELATNLFRVYEYWHHELVLANMQKSAHRIERLLPDFKDYRRTWAEAQKRRRAELGSAPVALQGGFVAVG